MKRIALLFFIGIFSSNAIAQPSNEYIDSLMNIATSNAFTIEGLRYADELAEIGVKYNIDKAIHRALECKACIYVNEDMYSELDAFCDSIDQNTHLQKDNSYVYYYIAYTHGKSYLRQSKFHLAINLARQMYDDGKKLMNESKKYSDDYEKGIETFLQGIDILAEAYQSIGQNDMAMAFYDESLEICRDMFDNNASINILTASYGRLCVALDMYKDSDGNKLLEYVDAFKIDLDNWVNNNNNDGYVSALLSYYHAIIEYISFMANIQIDDRNSVVGHYNEFINLYDSNDYPDNFYVNYYTANTEYYKYIGKYEMAMIYSDSLLNYQKSNGLFNDMPMTMHTKLKVNHLCGRYYDDYAIAEEMIALIDSLSLEKNSISLQEMSTLMGLEKAQQEAEHAKSQRTILVLYMAIGVVLLVMVIIVAILVIRNNIRQRKTNEELDQKNCELNQQKEEILAQNEYLEEQREKIEIQNHHLEIQNQIISQSNKDINDSLNYASLIQKAAMPSESVMKGIFGDHLLIYRPLKTVSGDFYWASAKGNIKMLAVGDCTGHGVPGAFLSILGISILNELASQDDFTSLNAASMLDKMRKIFQQSLNQKEYNNNLDGNHDGIDLAIALVDTKAKKLHYAGAFRPLIIVRDGEVIKIDADRMPIGVHYKAADHFTNHEIDIIPEDRIYMFSDGITDQFGHDEKGEIHKFTSKRLYKILTNSYRDPLTTQKTKIEMAFDNWRLEGLAAIGDSYEQTDDVVMVGVRV